MTTTIISSIVTMAIGIAYTIITFKLPNATVGRPMEPKIFPCLLGIFMIVLSFTLFMQEIFKKYKNDSNRYSRTNAGFKIGDSEKKIAITIANGVLYAILFNLIGYVFSTIIFLEVELIIFGGFKSWKTSTFIAVIFSVIAFVIFNMLLGIYLPRSPLGWI